MHAALVQKPYLLLGGLLLALVACHGRGHAADVRSGEQFTLKAEETVADDLYVFGQQITIEGTVEGDLIAFGQQITVNGEVKGDLILAGQTVVVAGQAQDARIAGQVLKLAASSRLEGDLMAAGFSLECEPESQITGDVYYGGFQALLAGNIDRNLHGGLMNCRLAGKVGGDVELSVDGEPGQGPPPMYGPPLPVAVPQVPGGLSVAAPANVAGKFTYVSSHDADLDPQATLSTPAERREPAAHEGRPAAPTAPKTWQAAALDRLRHAVSVLIVGLAALLLLPRGSRTWAETVRTRPAGSFLGGVLGVLAFVALLVVLVVAIIALAILFGVTTLSELVPAVIIGGLVLYAAVIVGFWMLAAFVAEAIASLALGSAAIRGDSFAARAGALALGLVVVALLLSIPYAGPWLGLLVFLFGFGGFCLWLIGFAPTSRPEATTPPPAGVVKS
jgi:cytoskeletal protein CcmA (bactofilin family)